MKGQPEMSTRQLAQIALEPVERAAATLPTGAKFLSILCPPGEMRPLLFAEVNPSAPHEDVIITTLAQGSVVPDEADQYVASFYVTHRPQRMGGPVRFSYYHVYVKWTNTIDAEFEEHRR